MTPEQFIKKAVEGGWDPRDGFYDGDKKRLLDFVLYDYDAPSNAEILLDPEAWRAVGKVEGWDEPIVGHWPVGSYRDRQLRFIGLLQSGDNIITSLAKATV